MSIYSNVTEKDLEKLRKLAEQQKEQRATKIKNRFLKQTHVVKLAESLSPITKKLDGVRDDIIKSKPETPQLSIANTQSPAIKNITSTQSLRDTLTLMEKSKNFFKLQETPDGQIFWNITPIKPQGENRVSSKSEEFDIKPNIQNCFNNTKLKTKRMDNEDELIIFNILKNVGFYDNLPKIGLKSARMKDALFNLPREIAKFQNPPLPSIENEYDNLEGQGIEKNIKPSNIIDIYTRLEVPLGLKLSGHSDTVTEASNLIDELYKRGEIQNKQQYRNALDKISS